MKSLFKFLFPIAMGLMLVGCGAEGSTTDNEGASNEKVINLTASIHNAPGIPFSDGFTQYLEEIEKRTDGKVKFEIFYSATLASENDIVDALADGVVDVAVVNPEYQSGKMSLGTITNNPGLYNNIWSAVMALNDLYDNNPAMQENLENLKIKKIGVFVQPPHIIHSSKDISSYDDVKNLRVLTTSSIQADVAKKVGMTPVGMGINDAYEAMDKGTIDAVLQNFNAAAALGFDEVLKSMWLLPVSGQSSVYAMSMDKWNSLPDDVKGIIEEVNSEFNADHNSKIFAGAEKHNEERYLGEDININQPTDEDLNKLNTLSGPIWEAWIKEQEKNGFDGQGVFDNLVELLADYEKQIPNK